MSKRGQQGACCRITGGVAVAGTEEGAVGEVIRRQVLGDPQTGEQVGFSAALTWRAREEMGPGDARVREAGKTEFAFTGTGRIERAVLRAGRPGVQLWA